MPELPEVETVVRTLRPRLVGRVAGRVRLLRQDILVPSSTDLAAVLTGRIVRAVERRGKKILIALDDGHTLCIHLGMSGRLTVEDPAAAVLKHTHLLVDFGEAAQMRFRDPRRFGGVWWLGAGECADGGMGPEPFAVRAGQLLRRLGRTRRAIKTTLLDQRVIAGLGNIYVDEALFAAGIHPETPANRLTAQQVACLHRAMRRILRQAIASRGSSLRDYVDADGVAGGFQKLHRVYGREGEPCRSCGGEIRRIVLGGRSTHFCPTCQPVD